MSWPEPIEYPDLPPDLEVVLNRHGDAPDDEQALHTLRDELTAQFQVQGALEEMLLHRVITLTWRLRRLQRFERGEMLKRTKGIRAQELQWRQRNGARDFKARETEERGLFSSDYPAVLQVGADALEDLLAIIQSREVERLPEQKALVDMLSLVFGFNQAGALQGASMELLVGISSLQSHAAGDEGTEDFDPAHIWTVLQERLAHALKGVHILLGDAQQRTSASDLAEAESKLLLFQKDLQRLTIYERHLETALYRSINQLQKAIARRKLASLAQALL